MSDDSTSSKVPVAVLEYEPSGLGSTAYKALAGEFLARHPIAGLA